MILTVQCDITGVEKEITSANEFDFVKFKGRAFQTRAGSPGDPMLVSTCRRIRHVKITGTTRALPRHLPQGIWERGLRRQPVLSGCFRLENSF